GYAIASVLRFAAHRADARPSHASRKKILFHTAKIISSLNLKNYSSLVLTKKRIYSIGFSINLQHTAFL
ncbi:MAG: hypothetical protein NZ519_09580, partial [Bacteroidia bacterium]|nr:hypothetical protein [Bacteroidia bacterium]